MLENVSIIIPFQTDYGPRAEAFEWVKKYYSTVMPEAELCLGIFENNEINKSKAVNQAAKNATRDIFVIADADIIYDPVVITESIKLLNEAAWVVPFTEIYDIPQKLTKKLVKSDPTLPINVELKHCQKVNWLYDEFAGKLNVIPREHFEAVGGFDERFIGWGGEDDAFSHAVNTLCGQFVNYEGRLFHMWHPPSHYNTNPNGQANIALLKRYIAASGNKEQMEQLIKERKKYLANQYTKDESTLSTCKICFSVLVHKDRELVKQLVENIRLYCPNSIVVLYNGGDDPDLCEDLGVPVCPTSHKLKRGFTTIYFLETMEWIEELAIEYDYFINIDSDSLFFRKGYEEFIEEQMKNTDYMAVSLRKPEEDWYIGKEMKKDIDTWKQLFSVDPLYGIFNVGQVINRKLVKALLEPQLKEKLTVSLTKTNSFGTDEILFVNMAKQLGFRIKSYPRKTDSKLIRFRPYFTLKEMIDSINLIEEGWLCHPIIREQSDPARELIIRLDSEHYIKQFKTNQFPWYENDSYRFHPSIPIKTNFGNDELIVQSDGHLCHYWEDPINKTWTKSETFAEGVSGTPLFYENLSGQFVVVCKLEAGGAALWWRDNKQIGYPWNGPFQITQENIEPIMLSQTNNGHHFIVCKSGDKLEYWVRRLLNQKEIWEKAIPLDS
ncbi:galactosyltransferase-related protein [Jeotgalibacillus soli]|uniref:Galactosyltransferase C-terminal domain-containing protein n=1 Tax=Jeotgalibacillus soli TaxID=889306 RepID=A0A0C2RTX5_9BACL|nr:galactosyltransferase-related protein [Jeotgalibacillus soli]KIL45199.1 hypothetical protein KP78_27430 [Jeotgalibacillus soli]